MSPKFDPEVLSTNGLACPYCKSSPERYRESKYCHPESGWPNLGRTIEHVKRYHTPSYTCTHCGHRWVASYFNDKTLPPVRTAHLEKCMPAHGGLPRVPGADEPEIMTEKGEEIFRRMKQIRGNNEKKLDKLYEACGKDLPDTYHVRSLEDHSIQSQLHDFPMPVRTGSNSTLLDGFTQPDLDPTLGPPRTLSWEQRNQNTACIQSQQAQSTVVVVASGADAAREQRDSGYEGSAEQETLCPVVDVGSLLYDSGGSSLQWNAFLPEHQASRLDYEGAHHEYPSEIDDLVYTETGEGAGQSCTYHDCSNEWPC